MPAKAKMTKEQKQYAAELDAYRKAVDDVTGPVRDRIVSALKAAGYEGFDKGPDGTGWATTRFTRDGRAFIALSNYKSGQGAPLDHRRSLVQYSGVLEREGIPHQIVPPHPKSSKHRMPHWTIEVDAGPFDQQLPAPPLPRLMKWDGAMVAEALPNETVEDFLARRAEFMEKANKTN